MHLTCWKVLTGCTHKWPVSRIAVMNPELRNWYLSNLGIVQYLPRSEEPVELPFYSASDSHPVLGSQSVPDIEEVRLATSSVKEKVASVLELVSETTNNVTPPVKEPVPERKSDSTTMALNFRLACWQPSDDLLVFNQFPPGVNPEPEHTQLLSNILKAIGRLSGGLSAPEIIDWPMSHGGEVDKSAARSMLSVFLDARVTKRGVLWVLLMGELAAELLSPSEKAYSDLVGVTEEISGGAKTIVVRSLQEMLHHPDTKAETWQAIKCLGGIS